MACGIINPDGSITITHPDINIFEVVNIIQDIQKTEEGNSTNCHEELLSVFTGKKKDTSKGASLDIKSTI